MNNKVLVYSFFSSSGLFICTSLQAEKIEQLSWFNLQEILEDDKLTYKIIKSCVSLNSAITELIKKEHPDLVDPTAINIHGAIHKKVPHAKCILHIHSKYATALSVLKNPTLPPIDQNTMRFYNRVAVYDDFGGLGFEEESNKMAACIGNHRTMLLANHGILTTGQTVAQAFDELFYFEKACETYITALSTGKELNIATPEVAEKTAQDWENYPTGLCELHLKALRSILDKEDPSYKQ